MSAGAWEQHRLEELVEFHDARRIPLSKKERAERQGSFPYYGAQGVIDSVDDFIFDGRYLLIAEDGENLNSRKKPVAFTAEGRFWVNNHAHVVEAVEGLADHDFVRVAVEFHPLNGLITGAAQPKLSQANLKRLEFRAPNYPAQRKIGNAIRAFDDLITNNRRRIEILEEMARLLYREWFVHFRFPGHEDVELVDSERGPIPEGWEVVQLRDMVRLSYGKALRADDRNGGPVEVYGSGGVVGHHDTFLTEGPGIVVGRKGNVGALYWSDADFFPIDTTYYVETDLPDPLRLPDAWHPQVHRFSSQRSPACLVIRHMASTWLSRERFKRSNTRNASPPMVQLRRNLIEQNRTPSRGS